ncbi:MAG TPA: alcohol dehydrogenase catalytic domain-containing protein, partial [Ktedonobacteraceae bacterium]
MWTSTLDFDLKRELTTRILSRIWHNACFSSFAPLQVRNLPRQPLPITNWVRVRNRLAGISGADLLLVQGLGDKRIAPAALPRKRQIYPGNEVVGEVIEIGEGVQHLRVGDRVTFQYSSNCISSGAKHLCPACADGNYNLCERGIFIGPQALGGGWSEEMLLHEDQLFRVAPELSDEQAVMLAPTAVALHAVLRHFPQQGEQILIVGAGTIGLLILQLVRALVPGIKISVLAKHAFQVEQATRMGADHIIYPNDSYAKVQQATNAQSLANGTLGNHMLRGGYDSIYDAVGSGKTLHHALRWARARGTIVLLGTSPFTMRVDLTPIWLHEVNLLGAFHHGLEYWPVGTPRQQTTFSIVEQLVRGQQIHPEQLITHRFALNNYREALLSAMSKSSSRAIKVVFDYSLVPASVVPNVRATARKPRPTASIASTTMEHPASEQGTFSTAVPQVTPVLTWEKEDETITPVSPGVKTTDQPATEGATVAHEEPYIADEEEMTVRVHPRDAYEVRRAVEQATSHEPPVQPEPHNVPHTEQSIEAGMETKTSHAEETPHEDAPTEERQSLSAEAEIPYEDTPTEEQQSLSAEVLQETQSPDSVEVPQEQQPLDSTEAAQSQETQSPDSADA